MEKSNLESKAKTNIDKIPKLAKKSFEEITAETVVDIPKNHVRPVNQRIFVIDYDPGEMKTEGGILLPTEYNTPEAKGGKQRKLRRYFVVDVAKDCNVKVERGDEVFPFIPQEAEEWSFPMIHDFYNHHDYIVIHETELAGVSNTSLLNKEHPYPELPKEYPLPTEAELPDIDDLLPTED